MANCLYNGVPLPDINTVWDKGVFKNAVIWTREFASTGTEYFLTLAEEEFGYVGAHDCWGVQNEQGVPTITRNNYLLSKGEWTRFTLTANVKKPCIWSSQDLYDANGLYLAASTPVPVPIAEPVNPAAMLAGLRLGQQVNWLRKKE